jgi:hypothetical protein
MGRLVFHHLEAGMFRRVTELLTVVAALSTVVAGCSSSGGGQPLASGGGGTVLAPPAPHLTGIQLRAALLPPSDFPPGYSVQGEQDSGGSLAGSATGVELATMSCAYFVSHSLIAILGATAYAEEGLHGSDSSDSSDSSVEYSQVIWQFANPVAAAKIYRGVSALADRCPKTSLSRGRVAEQAAIQAQASAPVGGHSSVEVDETLTFPGIPAMPEYKTLWSADGTALLDVGMIGVSGASAPQSPSLRTLMRDLMASVLAVR